MKFPHIEFLGTDQEVLDFVGAKKSDYETDYSNVSINVRLFGSHGKCNVPLGYHLVKDSDGALSVLTDEVITYITDLERNEFNARICLDLQQSQDKAIVQHMGEQFTKAIKLLQFWVNDFYDNFNHANKYEERHKALVATEQLLRENDSLKEKQKG